MKRDHLKDGDLLAEESLPLSDNGVYQTPETTNTSEAIDAVFASTEVGHPLSNADFMSAVFKHIEGDERPITICILGTINSTTKWGRGQGWTTDLCLPDTDVNHYFTLSTFCPTSEGYRRTKGQFKRAFGIMLDDIGTKAGPLQSLELCPPSYLIQTSPGNFQAGYLFDSPCSDIKRLEALNKAFIKAGLCDPGATGPTSRLGRLPNGINSKYDPPVRVSLVAWHPERRYSIQAIFDGFGLDRKPTSKNSKLKASITNGSLPIYEPSPTDNQVLERLKKRVFTRPQLMKVNTTLHARGCTNTPTRSITAQRTLSRAKRIQLADLSVSTVTVLIDISRIF